MDRAISAAILGALINVVLSTVVPCLMSQIKNKKHSFLTELKLTFLIHRHVLFTSSVVTAIAVYLAVKMEPEFTSSLPKSIINFLR
tara:strand:+ start:1099 stop:1356 length:258 start_codon:yes stop_codon:yes gene_type:complete